MTRLRFLYVYPIAALLVPALARATGFDYPLGAPDGTGYCVSDEEQDCRGLEFLERHIYGAPCGETYHPGEDWNQDGSGDDVGGDSNDADDPVYAAGDGVIAWASSNATSSWGFIVIIRHDGRFRLPNGTTVSTVWSRYGHLAEITSNPKSNSKWTKGDRVARGQQIGKVGDYPHGSGRAFHLHFEMRTIEFDLIPPFQESESAEDPDEFPCRKAKSWVETRWVDPTEFIELNRAGIPVRSFDFETPSSVEWSRQATATSPSGRRFLGEFSNETVRLQLSNLPPHSALTVGFDLFLVRSWDGNATSFPQYGPDVFKLAVGGFFFPATLMQTTFSTSPAGELEQRQAYPGTHPGGNYPPNKNTAEKPNSLGYVATLPDGSSPRDAVYRFSVTIPHIETLLDLDFSASGLQDLGDESWGLDDVEVRAIPVGFCQAPGGGAAVAAATTEQECSDSLDNDCDQSIDCADSDCSADPACVPVPTATDTPHPPPSSTPPDTVTVASPTPTLSPTVSPTTTPGEQFAYVTNWGSGTVSVIDTATSAVEASITVGTNPAHVVLSPDGMRAYITQNASPSAVSVIDTSTRAVVATIPGGSQPEGIALSPDGTRAYVAHYGGNLLWIVDADANAVIQSIPMNRPWNVSLSPDGSQAYVTSISGNTVSVIDTATGTVAGSIPVLAANAVAFTPDGSRAYVSTYSLPGTVRVIDTITRSVVTGITVGNASREIAMRADGLRAYVANSYSHTVSAIDTATNAVATTIAVGTSPEGLAATADGARVFVANRGANTVSVIDTITNAVVATIPVGAAPYDVAIGCIGSCPVAPTPTPTPESLATSTPPVTATNTPSTPSNLVMDRAFLYNLSFQEVTVPAAGDQVRFGGQWHADGSGTTPPFSIQVRIDGQVFETSSGFVATGGQTYYPTSTQTWTVTPGTHVLTWELDTSGAVSESSELDNARSYVWTTAATQDLVADAAIISGGGNPVHVGDTVSLSVNAHCAGTSGTTPAFQVRCTINGSPFYTTTTSVNCPGSFTVAAPGGWTVPAGSHTIQWTLDTGNVVPESNEANNQATSGFTAAPPETCNGLDDDGNGVIDDPGMCWRAIYRFQSSAGARCLGTSSGAPPSTCAGYTSEIEAFIVATNPVAGTFRAVQCSKLTDHIVVEAGSSDYNALIAASYNCSLELGYIYRLGQGPPSGTTPWANTCNLWRYRYNVSGGGAHLFTRGADNVTGMTCEPPARGQVFTNFPCFSGTAPGC